MADKVERYTAFFILMLNLMAWQEIGVERGRKGKGFLPVWMTRKIFSGISGKLTRQHMPYECAGKVAGLD